MIDVVPQQVQLTRHTKSTISQDYLKNIFGLNNHFKLVTLNNLLQILFLLDYITQHSGRVLYTRSVALVSSIMFIMSSIKNSIASIHKVSFGKCTGTEIAAILKIPHKSIQQIVNHQRLECSSSWLAHDNAPVFIAMNGLYNC